MARDGGEFLCYGEPVGFRYVRETLSGAKVYVRAADSIPASKEGDRAGMEFPPEWTPVAMSNLSGASEVPWVWDGFIAEGSSTLLVGLYKAGKTTLLAHLLKAMDSGGDVACPVVAGRALVVSEEAVTLWAKRRDEIGIGDHVEIISRPFKARPRWGEWSRFVGYVTRLVGDGRYKLVVLDALPTFLPILSENEAAEVLRALMPLHRITEAGAGLLLIHHPRKSGGEQGTASRGSGALPGWADIIVELRRYAPSDRQDTRRTLVGLSRFDETPDELVVELTPLGYRTVGSKADAKRVDRGSVYRELLPAKSLGLTVEEIRGGWPDDGVPRPGLRTIRADLDNLDDVQVTGAGTKGDPKRYSIPASLPSIGAGMESNATEQTDAQKIERNLQSA